MLQYLTSLSRRCRDHQCLKSQQVCVLMFLNGSYPRSDVGLKQLLVVLWEGRLDVFDELRGKPSKDRETLSTESNHEELYRRRIWSTDYLEDLPWCHQLVIQKVARCLGEKTNVFCQRGVTIIVFDCQYVTLSWFQKTLLSTGVMRCCYVDLPVDDMH